MGRKRCQDLAAVKQDGLHKFSNRSRAFGTVRLNLNMASTRKYIALQALSPSVCRLS